MAQHSPTLLECYEWVMEHCNNLLAASSNSNTSSDSNDTSSCCSSSDDQSDCLIAIESTRIFVKALSAPATFTSPLLIQLDQLAETLQTQADITTMVQEIQSLCQACKPWLEPVSFIECKAFPGTMSSMFRIEPSKIVPRVDYSSVWPNTINKEAGWFRQYMVGNPYITLVGPIQRYDITSASTTGTTDCESSPSSSSSDQDDTTMYAIITVLQENNTPISENKTSIQYRLIIRTSKETLRYVVSETTVKNTLMALEALGQTDRLDAFSSTPSNGQKQKQKSRPLRSFSSAIINHTASSPSSSCSSSSSSSFSSTASSSATVSLQCCCHHYHDDYIAIEDQVDPTECHSRHHHRHHLKNECPLLYRYLNAAVLSVYKHLDLRPFKMLSAEATIMSGLEKELLRFDELGIPKNYKFGVLPVRDNQRSEEKWFSNIGLSDNLEHFLNIIGRRITLHDYKGYAAGLDTKCGESGEVSYVTSWKDNEIMLHVGPLMPYNAQDKQQVHRKRYIGNDIVCIIFMETDQPHLFDPGAIRSQFLHVFIVIHPEIVDGKQAWRVEVVSNKNVPEFGPPIPSPPLFFMENELHDFLILKLVSAENAALQSDKFAIPNGKARQGIFKSLITMGQLAMTTATSTQPLTASSSFLRSKNGLDGYLAMMSGSAINLKSNNNNVQRLGNNQRPKSAGPTGRHTSRASIRGLRAALDMPSISSNVPSVRPPPPPPPPPTSSTSSSAVIVTRSVTPDQTTRTSSPSSSTSSSSSILFPYSSKSNMLRDLKSLTRRRHSTASTSCNNTPVRHYHHHHHHHHHHHQRIAIMDRPSHTDVLVYNHSPITVSSASTSSTSSRCIVESPVSWIDHECTMEPVPESTQHPPTNSSGLFSSLRSSSSTSLTSHSNTPSTASYYSPPSPPTSMDLMKPSNTVPLGESNNSIRSRAQHLMSTVMLGRRKTHQQQYQQQLAPTSTLSSQSEDTPSSPASANTSIISRISRAKSTSTKD